MTKLGAHLWIHSWSVAHGVTAAATAQLPDGGFLALTAETITAVGALSKLCGASWSKAFIESFVKQQFANRVGVEIARQTAGKIPISGNIPIIYERGICSNLISSCIYYDISILLPYFNQNFSIFTN